MNNSQYITITDGDSLEETPCYVAEFNPDDEIFPLVTTSCMHEAFEFKDIEILMDCIEMLDVNGYGGFAQDYDLIWEGDEE